MSDVPKKILTKLRLICLALPGAYEEQAWVGVRWMVRKRTFAHVLVIADGRPPAYARAAGSDGVVLTLRSFGPAHEVLTARGPPFFDAVWGTKWGSQVLGISLEGTVKWKEVAALITESHRLLAPKVRAK